MNILVTGGFGFCGGHLVERLLFDGHHVAVVDNLSSCPIPYWDFLSEIGRPALLSYHLMSVAEFYDAVTQATDGRINEIETIKATHFDAIFHLASPVGPAGVLKYAGRIARQIVNDTVLMANLAMLWDCRMLNVSTSEAYGGGQQGLCREDMPCIIQPETTVRLEYAAGKLAAEIALRNTEVLNHVTVRLFNVCGPRQSGENGFVLPRFVAQALNHQPLTIFGDGTAIRAFTDVRDIADGLVLAMERGQSKQVYNLGNPAGKTTIYALAQSVVSQIYAVSEQSDHTLCFTDGKEIYGERWSDAPNKFPDSTKATRDLGWLPKRSIHETVSDVIAYERQRIKA